jgi:branched-chain amino acid transport system substrate-binding protein
MMKKNLFVPLVVLAVAFLFLLTPVYGAPASGKPIKIGIIGPMDSRLGAHLMITAQMAADEVNARGGVKVGNEKFPIELVKISSNEFRKITDAIAAAERAITVDKVNFLIGGVIVEAISAIQDVAADNKTIYINTAFSVSPTHVERLTTNYNRYKYCFANAPLDAKGLGKVQLGIVEAVAKAVQQKGITKVRVAQMVEKNASGDILFGVTSKGIADLGFVSTGIWRPSPAATDLRAETAAIKTSKPHIIHAVFSSAAGMIFGQQLEELQLPAIAAGSPAASLFPGKGGIEYSVTMMYPPSIPIKVSDKNVAFYNEFIKRSGGEMCFGNSYDPILDLVASIEKIGTLDTDAIIKAMEKVEYNGVSGWQRFDPKDHRTVNLRGYLPDYGVQQLKGKYAIVWPSNAPVAKAQPVQIPQWMIDAWKNDK